MRYRIRITNPALGVPITFLDKYNPEQFEIIGLDRYIEIGVYRDIIRKDWVGGCSGCFIDGQQKYARILIRRKEMKQ